MGPRPIRSRAPAGRRRIRPAVVVLVSQQALGGGFLKALFTESGAAPLGLDCNWDADPTLPARGLAASPPGWANLFSRLTALGISGETDPFPPKDNLAQWLTQESCGNDTRLRCNFGCRFTCFYAFMHGLEHGCPVFHQERCSCRELACTFQANYTLAGKLLGES